MVNYEIEEEKIAMQTWQDLMDEGYRDLPWYSKLIFQAQTKLYLTILISVIVGYSIGAYFGFFWQSG